MPRHKEDPLIPLGVKIQGRTRRRLDEIRLSRFDINVSQTCDEAILAKCDQLERDARISTYVPPQPYRFIGPDSHPIW